MVHQEAKTLSCCVIAAGRTGSGLSFFRYAEELAPKSGIEENRIVPAPLRHIFSMMRELECDLIAEEEIDPASVPGCNEERLTLQNKIRPALSPLSRRVLRLTFFRSKSRRFDCTKHFSSVTDTARKDAKKFLKVFYANKSKLDCLGFAYLYVDSFKKINLSSYVPEAVVVPLFSSKRGLYVHSQAPFETHVEQERFEVHGAYFAQQEGATWCCAHAATMVALKNTMRAIGEPCSLTYEDMNKTLGIDHYYRRAGTGLQDDEIIKILDDRGVKSIALDSQALDGSADRVIATAYYAIEAGLPAIICFGKGGIRGHAMAVVGHTFDPCLWSPKASRSYFGLSEKPYLPSHSWMDNLVVQDDNFGPYCVLPRSTLWGLNPVVIIARFPESDLLTPENAELAAADILTEKRYCKEYYFQTILRSSVCPDTNHPTGYWFHKLLGACANRRHVLRTTPIKPQNYLKFLEGRRKPEAGKTDILAAREKKEILPELQNDLSNAFSWLVEISIPEVYQWNTRRLGEVLIQEVLIQEGEKKVTRPIVKCVRVPGVLSLPNASGTGFTHHKITGTEHYPIERYEQQNFKDLWLGK